MKLLVSPVVLHEPSILPARLACWMDYTGEPTLLLSVAAAAAAAAKSSGAIQTSKIICVPNADACVAMTVTPIPPCSSLGASRCGAPLRGRLQL